MTTLPALSPALEEELRAAAEESGDDVLSEYNRTRKADLHKRYPKPTEDAILALFADLKPTFAAFHQRIRDDREVRYCRDKMPQKWQGNLQDGRRVHSRLSNNEILRVRAMQTSHDPQPKILPSQDTDKGRSRAVKQTRWCKQLVGAFERQARRAIRVKAVDAQVGDGLGVFELFLTKAYDGLDLTRRENESPAAFMKRTDELIRLAGMPIGLRAVDPTAVYWDEDDDGPCALFIAEDKAKRRVMNALKQKPEQLAKLERPRPGTPGRPLDDRGGSNDGPANTIQTIRYYDHVWYAYIVDGVVVEGPTEHGLPRLPVYLMPCIVTGSPNLSERYQGVTWGMTALEKGFNDLLTQEIDAALTYGKPRPVIETDVNQRIAEEEDGTPSVLKLDDDGVHQLRPGQKLVDGYAGFKPHDTAHMQNTFQQLWQRSGLNPISQGESPGADPAGFTVNTLQQSAQKLYQISLQNEARTWEEIYDDVRLAIRDTIRDKVVLAAPMSDTRQGGTEWLALSPEDIDETPCQVTIPDDTNRLSVRQSLQQANKEGFISRRRVQEEGFGIEDTDAEDDEMILDTVDREMAGVLIEQVKQAYFAAEQPQQPPSGLVDQFGNPMPPSQPNGVGVGAIPAQPQPPSVGAGAAAASQGPAAMSPMTAQAGMGAGSPPVRT